MKPGVLVLVSVITLFAALATPVSRAAQERQQTEDASSVDTSAANPTPLINQPLVPDAVKPGGTTFTLTVNGTGFVSGSVVKWNVSARATTFESSSQLKATILSSDIAKACTASVTVVNPSPGGGTSNVVLFGVTTPNSAFGLAEAAYATSDRSYAVAVGDFNGDGKPDLAVAN